MAPGHVLMPFCALPVYAAGKAATSGVPSIYAHSTYAHLSPAKTPPPPPALIPMGPVYNGYPGDFDRNSSGEASEEGRARTAGTRVDSPWTVEWDWDWRKVWVRAGNDTDNQSPPVANSSQVPLLRDTDSSVTSGKNPSPRQWTCLWIWAGSASILPNQSCHPCP
jgi:hypothetical protein